MRIRRITPFTTWFGARLSAAGYEVWTDLTRLLGGEEMWADIDDALRSHARKVIVLLSRAITHPQKESLRAEVNRAEAFRKRLEDRRFIIPIRIDDVAFDDLPPTLGNRTVIDGSTNLAGGLAQVLKILREDHVPCSVTLSSEALSRWHILVNPGTFEPEQGPETLITNWFQITRLPETIHVYSIERPLSNPLIEPAKIASEHPLPMTAHLRRLIALGDHQDVQDPIIEMTPLKLDSSMPLKAFLSGGTSALEIGSLEARKHLKSLLRQAFDLFARRKGLQPYALSEAKTVWWMPDDLLSNPKIDFVRPSGVGGWRRLLGDYSARNRRWHFGVNAVPLFDPEICLKLTGHVVFSDPSGKTEPTAEYRRAMCKFWFNGKWRDLLLAMAHFLSDGKDVFALPFGRDVYAQVLAKPSTIVHPVRLLATAETKVRTKAETEGDAADIDTSERETDPSFATDLLELEHEGLELEDEA